MQSQVGVNFRPGGTTGGVPRVSKSLRTRGKEKGTEEVLFAQGMKFSASVNPPKKKSRQDSKKKGISSQKQEAKTTCAKLEKQRAPAGKAKKEGNTLGYRRGKTKEGETRERKKKNNKVKRGYCRRLGII